MEQPFLIKWCVREYFLLYIRGESRDRQVIEESCAAAVSQGGVGELETDKSGRRHEGLLNAPTLSKSYPLMGRRLMEGFACRWTGCLHSREEDSQVK
ncbi:hypothetical protein E2C01_001061 [Portunus trituberculatus]|uniref:Uncharacterized protein n=1 Tax=Portunus trituberculatus TaxID=210409 RepID=A0A5B7CIE7_PORTR|nr:hypothetical protein [Portunus trituberculatus]